ncbi:MAG: hypothetical protein IJ642_02570 [Oscillospiraceae bacterium]|nr:hypothetical protein [Oscillospiraceae bacterium]
MIHRFNQFEIPDIYYFEAGNYFTGSRKSMNFKIVSDGKEMTVTTWQGFICSELAEQQGKIQSSDVFPVTKDGHQAMLEKLEELYQKITAE